MSRRQFRAQGAVHFRGGHDAGEERQVQHIGLAEDGLVQSGRDAEFRAGVECLADLIRGKQRAGADANIRHCCLADAGDGIGGGGGAGR